MGAQELVWPCVEVSQTHPSPGEGPGFPNGWGLHSDYTGILQVQRAVGHSCSTAGHTVSLSEGGHSLPHWSTVKGSHCAPPSLWLGPSPSLGVVGGQGRPTQSASIIGHTTATVRFAQVLWGTWASPTVGWATQDMELNASDSYHLSFTVRFKAREPWSLTLTSALCLVWAGCGSVTYLVLRVPVPHRRLPSTSDTRDGPPLCTCHQNTTTPGLSQLAEHHLSGIRQP